MPYLCTIAVSSRRSVSSVLFGFGVREFASKSLAERSITPPKKAANSRTSPVKKSSSAAKTSSTRGNAASNPLFIPIIYESQDLICVNKPANVFSQPGNFKPGGGSPILDLLAHQRPHLKLDTVHRLDRNTTGAMILSCRKPVTAELGRLFAEDKIEKNYLALLKARRGTPLYTPDITSCHLEDVTYNQEDKSTSGTIEEQIPQRLSKLRITQSPESTSGYILIYEGQTKTNVTHFHVLDRFEAENKVFVLFTPFTGRKHQLRKAAAFLGAPIVGDHKYGYPDNDGVLDSPRIRDNVYKDEYALHCFRIASGIPVIEFDVHAPLPNGRSGDVWNCVRSQAGEDGFLNKVKEISIVAKEVFREGEVQYFLKHEKKWAKKLEKSKLGRNTVAQRRTGEVWREPSISLAN